VTELARGHGNFTKKALSAVLARQKILRVSPPQRNRKIEEYFQRLMKTTIIAIISIKLLAF
jgi:hypothetical protein